MANAEEGSVGILRWAGGSGTFEKAGPRAVPKMSRVIAP
jgi:hypothetical protein